VDGGTHTAAQWIERREEGFESDQSIHPQHHRG